MDSPYFGRIQDSPFLRAQEGKYGQTSSFSLGPGMHEAGGGDAGSGSAVEAPQSTADLTAFVQNLLQQMQLRFQSMSDAILARIDEMASRIEDMEKAVDEVLREVTGEDDQVALPSPSSSPNRRALAAPPSPNVRKLSMPGSYTPNAASNAAGRFASSASLPSSGTASLNFSDGRRQSIPSGALDVPSSPDLRRHSYVPSSPDLRRHSSLGSHVTPPQAVPNSPDLRRQSLSSSYAPTSPDVRKSLSSTSLNFNAANSPDARKRSDIYGSGGTQLR